MCVLITEASSPLILSKCSNQYIVYTRVYAVSSKFSWPCWSQPGWDHCSSSVLLRSSYWSTQLPPVPQWHRQLRWRRKRSYKAWDNAHCCQGNVIIEIETGVIIVVFVHIHVCVFQKPEVASLDEIFQKIQDAIYKNGIRTTEFFRDHDKLRSGVITENQVHGIGSTQFTCSCTLYAWHSKIKLDDYGCVRYYKM